MGELLCESRPASLARSAVALGRSVSVPCARSAAPGSRCHRPHKRGLQRTAEQDGDDALVSPVHRATHRARPMRRSSRLCSEKPGSVSTAPQSAGDSLGREL